MSEAEIFLPRSRANAGSDASSPPADGSKQGAGPQRSDALATSFPSWDLLPKTTLLNRRRSSAK